MLNHQVLMARLTVMPESGSSSLTNSSVSFLLFRTSGINWIARGKQNHSEPVGLELRVEFSCQIPGMTGI